MNIIKKDSGVSLIELVIVVAIIGILALVGIPQYGQFIAKGKVRRAADELLQNMRLTRTMAIKENGAYLITFDAAANNYRIGFDGNGDGDLLDNNGANKDGYERDVNGNPVLPVKVFNLQTEYGNEIVVGSANFSTNPPNGPNGVAISDALSFQLLPDGSINANGQPLAARVYFQHSGQDRGYTFCVELANSAGTINLFMWDGSADPNQVNETEWPELR
ncbi:MAG: prepilin-type N-terminal cleavage/methylation domain-containing protein [Nitrospirae bacterium]|nr:prepilin-type N-terminal cleavage/methylation domain-containing protein [Nitrospirota bacterium]